MNILEKLRQGSPLAQIQSSLRLQEQRIQSAVVSLKNGFTGTQAVRDLKQFIEEKSRNKNPHGYHEIDRVCNLPVSFPLTDEEFNAYCQANILKDAFEKGFRLKRSQAEALLWYDSTGKVFCPIGAGAGKTLVDVAIASRAYRRGIQKILLLIPSHVYYQFVARSLPWIRNQIPVQVPFIGMGNTTSAKRLQMAHSNRPGCYVLPYSCLSTRDADEVLNAIKPALIIADEAHRVSQRRAARTRRLDHFVKKHQPGFVPLSGTITGKTVMEYHHLISWALRESSPLPLSPQMASEWGQFIDAKAEYTGTNAGPITKVIEWARQNFPDVTGKETISNDVTGFRKAYRLRLTTAPGVVATADTDVTCSLYLSNRPVVYSEKAAGWIRLKQLMDQIVDNYITPNGDQIEHAIHTFKWLYELSAGFYNELVWPAAEDYAKRKGLSDRGAIDVLERAQIHHDLQQILAKELRKWLSSYYRPGLDTPFLVYSDMNQHGAKNVGRDLYAAWQDKKAAEFEGMPERDSNAIRVFDYKVKAAVAWAEELEGGGIVWAHNQEMVRWIHDSIPGSLLADAGEASNRRITDPNNSKKIIVASISAHGEGKELQHFQNQYYVQWPRPAKVAEQVLARLHRLGQTADELIAVTNNTTLFDQLNFAACLNDALYIQQTTGNQQRVIYAGYDPLPVIFPPNVLRERGMQPLALTKEHQQVLVDLFGASSETQ